MGTHWKFAVFARVASIAGVLLVVAGLLPSSAAAGHYRREVGKYFLADDFVQVAGGAILYDDCTHDGGLIASPQFGPPQAWGTYKLVPTYWVNNPDPTVLPYSLYAVPAALEGKARLFLCFDVEPILGTPPPFSEFCDWAPRDMRTPLEVFDENGVRDLLLDVDFRRGPRLCASGPN